VTVERHRQNHVIERNSEEWAVLDAAALEWHDLDIGEGDERSLGRVEVVGQAAAVAVPRQAERSRVIR
jgi:hypothetical protein